MHNIYSSVIKKWKFEENEASKLIFFKVKSKQYLIYSNFISNFWQKEDRIATFLQANTVKKSISDLKLRKYS